MFSSIKEKFAGEDSEENIQDSELIDEVKEEISGDVKDNEISRIEESLAHVDELEKALEEEMSENLELGDDSEEASDVTEETRNIQEQEDNLEPELEPVEVDDRKEGGFNFGSEKEVESSETGFDEKDIEQSTENHEEDKPSQKDQIKGNLAEAEDSIHKPTLPGPENNPQNLESEVKSFEEKIVSDESRELAKINDLEQRVERMELRSTEDLEERIQRLEQKIESMQTVEKFRDRLEELEEVVEDQGPEKVDELEGKIDQLWEAFDEEFKGVEQEESRTDRKLRLLWQALELNLEDLESDIDGNGKEVEELWEAMDEEMMDVEARIHDNKEEIEDLYSIVLELSELVKEEVEQINH